MEIVKVKQILLEHIPEESVNEILDYYISIYFYENISMSIDMFSTILSCKRALLFIDVYRSHVYRSHVYGNHVYYKEPKKYWTSILRLSDVEMSQRDKIITLIRYWIQNSDLFLRNCTLSDYGRLRNCIRGNLTRNIRDNPNWAENVGKYYYRQVFFKEAEV